MYEINQCVCTDTQTAYTSPTHLLAFSTLVSAVPKFLLDFILGEVQRGILYSGRETTEGTARVGQIHSQVFRARSRLRVVLRVVLGGPVA